MSRLISFVILALSSLYAQTPATDSRYPGTSSSYGSFVDQLQYADLIVRGRIQAAVERTATYEQLGRPDSGIAEVEVITLANPRLLRGPQIQSEVFAWLMGLWNLVGKEVILCAYWRPGVNSYVVENKISVFVLTNGHWERFDDGEILEDAELMSRIGETLPESLVRSSDLVVRGRVVAAGDSILTIGNKSERGTKIVLEDVEYLKGSGGESLTFLSRIGSQQRAIIGDAVPGDINVGETWLVILAERNGLLVPVAGRNGLLLVQGETLLYRRVSPYRYSVRALRELATEAGLND